MSIYVSIRNDDSRESAVIGVRTQWLDADGKLGGDYAETELKGGPGGSGDRVQLLVHGSQQIVVRELRQ